MDVEKLKQKILDLAIRGKLVPQDPNDEPASVLIEKIKAEKAKLVKEGKIKASKEESYIFKGSDNFYYEKIGNKTTCIQDEIPFEIPDSWEWCRLENIGNTNIGLTYSPDDISDTGIIVLRSSNIKNGRLIFDDFVKVNKAIKLTQYVQKNDIIICARNGSKSLVGKCAIIESSEPMTFGAFMAIFRTVIYEYAYYYFNSDFFRSYFENDDNKQINQVTQEILKKSLIPIPPFHEQQRIIKVLKDSFKQFELISENLQNISLYKSCIKLKILDIYFGENSSYKSYYGKRLTTTLKELVPLNLIGDGDWVLSENMDSNGEFKLIQLKHISNGNYLDKPYQCVNNDFFEKHSCSEIKENYLLINRLVADSMSVCIVPKLPFRTITAVDVCWIAPSPNIYNQEYLMYYLMSPGFQSQLLLKCGGTTRKRISKSNLINIPLHIHNIKYQEIIGKRIKDIFLILDNIAK